MGKRTQAIEALYQQAVRQQLAGRGREADRMYRDILAAVPTHADSRHMLGVLALQADQPAIALRHFDQAIATSARTSAYHLNRANALRRLGRMEEALASCREALRLNPGSAEAHQVHGHILSDLGDAAAAVVAYQEAARRKPGLFDVHNNLGIALRHTGRLEEAEQALREALRREPGEPGITLNLSNVLKELGRVTEAETCLRDALRARPNDPMLRYHLGLLLLLMGRFQEGWAFYDSRAQTPAVAARPFPQPTWHAEALAGRTLLVHAEQGLGDTIQFCRYVPSLMQRVAGNGQVVFEVQRSLASLLASLPGPPAIVPAGVPLPPFDLVCPLMSLPERFGTTPESVPHNVPYLSADPGRVARWRERLGPHGFKIGIAWQGNPSSQAELGRSIPLARFLPLARLPGVRLISVQKEHGLAELSRLAEPSAIELPGADFDAGPDAFVDTAAIMAGLDLVITSDTAIAHLAGALARPVWVALQHVPDWRWMLQPTSDSPWYPTMRLFRQGRRGAWEEVFERIERALRDVLEARAGEVAP